MRSFKPGRKLSSFKGRRYNHGKKRFREAEPVEPRPTRINKDALRLLAQIGTPERTPFVPDPFQIESLEKVLTEDVLVSAPTGSGKTWIALEATKEYLARGCGIWYATPLKALSNAKYEEFGQIFGPERVGILTGDRKENANAPVIVGTTEILRNQLYDSMQAGFDLNLDLVILDEAHYLGDPDRGVVWEEVSIYLPARVRLLLLSATISNATTVAGWLTHIRGTPCRVVYSGTRPVPLYVLFRAPDGHVLPFFLGKRLHPEVASYAKEQKGRKKFSGAETPDASAIVETLRHSNLLPAIVFLKSRSDCDKALNSLLPSPVPPHEDGFEEAVNEQLSEYPELRNQRQLTRLLAARAGSHHAGQLPGWRLMVERMMVQGHLDVIFSTSTVAAGVNFPARSVVILQSDRFNGRSFVDMTSTDLHQMTGRAGRRGMDNAGFTLVVPGKFLNIPLLSELLLSPPEPLQSRIAVNFSMALNLLLSHDPAGVTRLLGLSFAAFHESRRRAERETKRLIKEFYQHSDLLVELGYLDENAVPTYDGQWAAKLRLDHPLLIAELIRSGEFSRLNPEELAALVAPFVMDKDKETFISKELWARARPLWKKFRKMMRRLKPLMELMISRGFSVPVTMFWPAAAVLLWSQEVDWDELTEHVEADEGDLAMLILRTADHLRQIASLENEEPALAQSARIGLKLLMRSPIV